ncbi:mitochondrial-processing peptidase subunit alpha [Macrosteles quadrilineatus]|uniref:mitochondrial-processing peptidase subunit alpha n=1 Tax=Macrosteles quadrilineatus TaxID=74068 RepID=UPI0023E28ECA|nr:mitochondrial-processing peptidase subunit alpha [Macrosteles quadrilineatus]
MAGKACRPIHKLLKLGRNTNHKWEGCNFSSSTHQSGGPPVGNNHAFQQVTLNKPLPNLPLAKYASAKEDNQTTQITTLPSGLRVASENRFGQFCTVGVVIDSGSRYEVAFPSGISHFLEKLAFNSTEEFKNKDHIMQALEKHGGICDCQSSRDTFVYAASADVRGLEAVIRILGDVVFRPQLSLEEIDIARQTIKFELDTLLTRPEQETLLMDMIHGAAYRSNTLGLPKICPESSLDKIDANVLMTYLKSHHTLSRMVVAGVGVDHQMLVDHVNRYFVERKPTWEENKSIKPVKVDNSTAQYTGGLVQEECEVPQYAGPSGLPELAHVVVALEGVSHQDPDFIPVCVLNMMMGGGGSFSAGGPGKGMYTRLYTNVLNRYHWMYNATAYNHAYADTGLFCIHASATPPHVRDMVDVLTREVVAMAGPTGNKELRRAKTQLQSMLLMNLEARPVVFEDIARQVLATGQRKRPEVFMELIENVTSDDISRVAQRMLRSQPAVAARGKVEKLPALADIQAALNKDGRLSNNRSRLSLFR